LRDKSADELVALEKDLRQGLFDQRLKNFTNRLDDTSLVRKARRDIARVRTLLAEKSRQKA
jgi:large subunit ribosomal protein L29